MNTLQNSIYAFFALLTLVILADYLLPGRIVNDQIVELKKELQEYNNAAKNYHYSYRVYTSEHDFSVSEEFAELDLEDGMIEYSISPIFKEVNWYKLVSSEDRSVFSLRMVSGFILPLLVLVSILFSIRSKLKMEILIYVLIAFLIADLIFLIL